MQGQVKLNILRKLSETPKPKHDLRNVNSGNLFSNKHLCNDLSFTLGENVTPQGSTSPIPTVGKSLNTFYPNSRNRQVCATEKEAKNLSQQRTRQKQAAGATEKADIKGKIVEHAWWMKKEGYAETTIRLNTVVLKVLTERGADIFNPESIKETIAKQKWSEARRHTAIASYSLFLKMLGGTWTPPPCKET